MKKGYISVPFFIPNILKEQLLEGCQNIISFIQNENFKNLINRALLNNKITKEDSRTAFSAIDFGISEEDGKLFQSLRKCKVFLYCIIYRIIHPKNSSINIPFY